MELPWHWEISAFNFCLCMLSQVATACRTCLETLAMCPHWGWLWNPMTLTLNCSAIRMQLYRMSLHIGCRMFSRLYGAKCDTPMNTLRYNIFSTRLKVPSLKSLPQQMTVSLCIWNVPISKPCYGKQRIGISHRTCVCATTEGRCLMVLHLQYERVSRLDRPPELVKVIA